MSHQQIVQRLVEICHEDGVLRHTNHPDIANADFSHCGIDSMSFEFLQAVIEEEWSVHVPATHFTTQFHNLNSIAIYVAKQVTSDRRSHGDAPSAV